MSLEHKAQPFSVSQHSVKIGQFLKRAETFRRQLPSQKSDHLSGTPLVPAVHEEMNKRAQRLHHSIQKWTERKAQYDSIIPQLEQQETWFAEHVKKPHEQGKVHQTVY